MGLNPTVGNMYKDVDMTWNTVKGICSHDCSFCYMKRWGTLNPVRLDEKEFKTDLGKGNFIFVGSSCDMFADDIPSEWVIRTLEHCAKFDNKYLFQSKNPRAFNGYAAWMPENIVFCTSLESDIHYPDILKNAPSPEERAVAMIGIPVEKYVTIEPIMNFTLFGLLGMISAIKPVQVNVGSDSGGNGLPEPTGEQVEILLHELGKITKVVQKKNLARLLK